MMNQGFVVFVDKHDYIFTGLFRYAADKPVKAARQRFVCGFCAPFAFKRAQLTTEACMQIGNGIIFADIEINEKNGIFRPFFFKLINCESLKKLFIPLEIGL